VSVLTAAPAPGGPPRSCTRFPDPPREPTYSGAPERPNGGVPTGAVATVGAH
jgi:hypothetical protein